MSADLKSLFPATPALRSVLRPEDLAAETLARHLPWLSAPADNLILTRQGDLIASAVVEGQDSFTREEGDLSLATTSLARLIGQLGEGFGFHVSKLTLPDAPQLKPFDGEGSGEAFAAMVDARWQAHLRARTLKRRVLVVSLILRPTVLKRVPLIGALFKAAFTGDLGQRIERLNEAMGLLAGACQGLGFRPLSSSSGEWLGLLGVLLGQPMAKVLPMRGQFLAEAVASSQMTFAGKRVEIETGEGMRFGTIFGVKSYPARTWARMLDALELPYDIVITNSFTPARNNEIEERIKRTARQMRASVLFAADYVPAIKRDRILVGLPHPAGSARDVSSQFLGNPANPKRKSPLNPECRETALRLRAQVLKLSEAREPGNPIDQAFGLSPS